jgi:hypothetical protein
MMNSVEAWDGVVRLLQQCSHATMQQCSKVSDEEKKFKHFGRFSAAHQQPGTNPIKHFTAVIYIFLQ